MKVVEIFCPKCKKIKEFRAIKEISGFEIHEPIYVYFYRCNDCNTIVDLLNTK